jgi:hypothetical protein
VNVPERALGPRLPVPAATNLREEGKRYKGGTDAILGVLDKVLEWFSVEVYDRIRVCLCLCSKGEIRGCFLSATGAGEPVEED